MKETAYGRVLSSSRWGVFGPFNGSRSVFSKDESDPDQRVGTVPRQA